MGGFDILANNAVCVVAASLAETTDDDFDRVMAVKAKAVFLALWEAARHMRDSGRVITVSTTNTRLAAPERPSTPAPRAPSSSSRPWWHSNWDRAASPPPMVVSLSAKGLTHDVRQRPDPRRDLRPTGQGLPAQCLHANHLRGQLRSRPYGACVGVSADQRPGWASTSHCLRRGPSR
ncbi:SDR family NAD(P)-dependent oxidoreductase [Streptomyces sp. 900105755]